MKNLMTMKIGFDEEKRKISISLYGDAPIGALAQLGILRLIAEIPNTKTHKEAKKILAQAMTDPQFMLETMIALSNVIERIESLKLEEANRSCTAVN